jgi:cell division septum initiation protein DivIVA
MHINEGRMSKQLEMKLTIIERAVQQLINITSGLAIENQRLNQRVNHLSKQVAGGSAADDSTSKPDDIELNIANVQNILKQQKQGPAQQGFGKKIITN